MDWTEEQQKHLNMLRAAERRGTLTLAEQVELAELITALDTDERARLNSALTQLRAEQAALLEQLRASEAEHNHLVRCAEIYDCEAELLELQIKYGMDYAEFQQQLNAGALGDAFGYALG